MGKELSFLSDEAVRLHKEYLQNLKLRYSVLTKSVPQLVGKNIKDVKWLKIKKEDKRQAEELLGNILAHELYFNSFSHEVRQSRCVSALFGSEASFLYEVYLDLKEQPSGFLLIYKESGAIKYVTSDEPWVYFIRIAPLLAVDLYEHAYFLDWGFDRDGYIKGALSRLDLSKLD